MLYNALDNGKKNLVLFLDLEKAFDTVSHSRLLKKFSNYGVKQKALQWFASYLSQRQQQVKVGGHISDHRLVTWGIPQGTVIGPILFSIYINDLCNLDVNGMLKSFADDTILCIIGRTRDIVHREAERALSSVKLWLDQNKLTLNIKKTNYITFSLYKRSQPKDSVIWLHVEGCISKKCNCKKVNKVNSTKYLGIIIDQNLRWENHIESLVKKTRLLFIIVIVYYC